METANLRISDPHLDWASLTVQLPPERIVDAIRRKVRGAWNIRVATPKNRGYSEAFEVLDTSADPLCTVEAGASHGWNLVTATGTQPNVEVLEAVRMLAAHGAAARATRLDSAIDVFGGDFDQLAGLVEMAAKKPKNGAPVRSFERWDSPTGRTLYVGSRAAAVRVRVYEKGAEQRSKGNTDAPLDWVRLELQWRPSGAQRTVALDYAPEKIWGASAWTADVAQQMLHADVQHVAATPEMTSFEQSYEWLCKSASGIFCRAVERFGLAAVVADLTGESLEV
ncbi:MAG: replication initiation factor domain-containing protein [Bifidobacterium ruminantium]|nr:replication initiation factor domain-containing protein [Bifidobacterium ruminantium]